MSLWRDIRYAARTLRKAPGFTAAAVLTLALGIGATATLFAAFYAVVLRPLPYSDADRIVILSATFAMPGRGASSMGWSYPKFRDMKAAVRGFEQLGGFAPLDLNVTGTDAPERIRAEVVTPDYLALLDVKPILGRRFDAGDDVAPNAQPVVLISQRLWTRKFGAESAVLGRTLNANDTALTIVGVLPDWFFGESGRAELWVPVMMAPALVSNPKRLDARMAHWMVGIGRISREVTFDAADRAVKSAVQQMEMRVPSGGPPGTVWSASTELLADSKIDPLMRRALVILLGAVAAVLLVGCLNLANLLLGRALGRSREVAICMSLGASRWTLARRFSVESLAIAAMGGAAGLLVAAWTIDLLRVLQPQGVWQGEAAFVRGLDFGLVEINAPIVVFTAVIAFAAAIAFGALPAWIGSRTNLAEISRSGDRGLGSGGQRRSLVRRTLIVAQIAVACVLLAAAGLMIGSFAALLRTDLGFKPGGILTMRVELPAPRYDAAAIPRFFDALGDRLRGLPGVEDVAVAGTVPLRGLNEITRGTIDDLQIDETAVHMVSPAFFRTFGIPLKEGRLLADSDRAGTPHVALINESAARRFWPGTSPIGDRIGLGLQGWSDPGDRAEIVGVVGDTRYRGIGAAPGVDVYLSHRQRGRRSSVIAVRTRTDPLALIPAIRGEVAALDRALPAFEAMTMEETVRTASARTRFATVVLAFFAASALLLAAIGLYGVIAYGVAARTREIGIRLALGAHRPHVVWEFVREGAALGGLGLALGIPLALALSGMLRGLLYQIQPGDPATLAAVAVCLLLTCTLAAYVPARRASRIDPSVALRYE